MRKITLILLCLFCSGMLPAQSRFDSTWTRYFRLNSGGWTAGDATISVRLPDNRVLWLFGDSFTVPVNVNNTLPCLFQVRNCMMVQDSVNPELFTTILDTTQTGVNQTPFKLVPNDTTLFWPGAGYVRGDTVFIYFERYHNTTLEYFGCYLAKLSYPGLQQYGLYRVNNLRSAIFGRAVYPDESAGKLYIYGNKLNWIIWEPVLARVDLDNPMGKWEYYDGTGWSLFSGSMVKISDEAVSPGFSVFPHSGKYYLITQENGYLECGLGREIYSMESDLPEGPFLNKKLLYTEESKFNDRYLLTYNAQAHPWAVENNELLIGYNVNDRVDSLEPYVCPGQCVNAFTDRMDADTYRPKFIRVPMDMIVTSGELRGALQPSLAPVPASPGERVTLSVDMTGAGSAKLLIMGVTGEVIGSSEHLYVSGKNFITMTAPGSPGVYFVLFRTKYGNSVKKLIVRN